jgi:hypothetical protein
MGVFQCGVFQQDVFQNDCAGSAAAAAAGAGGGYAKAWDDHWKAKAKRDRRKAELLALIRASDEYRRLKRKLLMAHEHLLDDPKSWRAKEKIVEIEAQIEMMERL